MNLKDINTALNHQIVGGTNYQWHCYGNDTYMLDYQNEFGSASAVFDINTQKVYEASVEILDQDKAYRYIDPDYKSDFICECKARDVDPSIAWDDVKFIDLEVQEDFLEKAKAIFENMPFDERVKVPLDLHDQEFLQLALEAHKRDITLNKMVEVILQTYIDGEKNE